MILTNAVFIFTIRGDLSVMRILPLSSAKVYADADSVFSIPDKTSNADFVDLIAVATGNADSFALILGSRRVDDDEIACARNRRSVPLFFLVANMDAQMDDYAAPVRPVALPSRGSRRPR